jgi:hypothetical protein
MSEAREQRATHIMHGMGRFFMVLGVLNLVLAAIGLVAVLVTGPSGKGLALIAAAIGSGLAWWFVGYAMRRLTL